MNISYLAIHIIRKQLKVLVVEKVASASIVSKLSQSGIGLAHLELALNRRFSKWNQTTFEIT